MVFFNPPRTGLGNGFTDPTERSVYTAYVNALTTALTPSSAPKNALGP